QSSPGGPIQDEVTSIAIHPTRPQDQYFGTTVNGVLRTTGNGRLEVFNENLKFPSVQSLAFNHRTPPTLYARLLATAVAAHTFGNIVEPPTFVPDLQVQGLVLAGVTLVLIFKLRRRTLGTEFARQVFEISDSKSALRGLDKGGRASYITGKSRVIKRVIPFE